MTETLLFLDRPLGCSPDGFLLAFTPTDQTQGIGGVERELPDRSLGLTRSLQSDVHPAIAGQLDDGNPRKCSLPFLFRELGVLFNRRLHFLGREVVLRSESLGFDIALGNALLDQKALHPSHAPL